MTMTPAHTDSAAARPAGALRQRLAGPDVVRAVALIGVVVMNYHGYLALRSTSYEPNTVIERLFDPWTGPLSTRFAATFVLVAGVGITLLTRTSMGDTAARAAMQWRLVRRGIVLYVAGLVLDTVWPGTILPFYGAMFVVAAIVLPLRSRTILAGGLVAAIAGAGIEWWRYQQQLNGELTTWFDGNGLRTPSGMLLGLFVNGTHPLLPWLAFFCAGIAIGRLLGHPMLRPAMIIAGVTMFGFATLIAGSVRGDDDGSGLSSHLASDDPFDRGLMYTASALGTAMVAFAAITWLAERSPGNPAVRVLGIAGQMTLTLYVAHALVFNLVVDWLEWIRPTGLDTALTFALGYWLVGLLVAWLWARRFRRGPLEMFYRALTA